MVVAAGVAMFVMYLSNFDSLRATQRRYYERQRFADVFASLKRAPQRVADEIAAHPRRLGASRRAWSPTSRSTCRGLDEPATGRLVSIPRGRAGRASTTCSCAAGAGSSRAARTKCWPARVRHRARAAARRSRAPRSSTGGCAGSPSSASRCRPSSSTASGRASWCPTTGGSASSGWTRQALAAAFDMEGGFNDVVADAGARRRPSEAIVTGSTACSSRTAGSARSRARCSCRTGRSRTSSRSCRASASCCR